MALLHQYHVDLHVHPFLGQNTLLDVIERMCKNSLDIVGLASLDATLYPQVLVEARAITTEIQSDQSGVKIFDRYLLNAREYNTAEGFHLLTIGYSFDEAQPQTEIREIIDQSLEKKALVVLDHPFVDNGKTRTAGQISPEKEEELEILCKEYAGKIALEWNGYCIPWIRNGLKYFLKMLGQPVSYHDVNQKVEDFSQKLAAQGYKLPVLAGTDLHARNKHYLRAMGTARFIAPAEGDSASEVLQSIIGNIFSRNCENIKNYVSAAHLFRAFCLPILFPKLFEEPRG